MTISRRAVYFLLPVLLLLGLLAGFLLLKAPADVAFLGDSLTHGWYFPTVNLGIYGNTTAKMLERFPSEVPGHRFKRLVILGGTNDVLLHVDPAVTIHNLDTMATAAQQDGAQPVLCEIPPIFHSFNPDDQTDYSSAVQGLNRRIVQLAAERHWKLIDYYDPLLGHPSYSSDGVHMTHRGYAVMEWTYFRESPPN